MRERARGRERGRKMEGGGERGGERERGFNDLVLSKLLIDNFNSH